MKSRIPAAFLTAMAASLAAAAAQTPQAAKDGVYLPTANTQSETDEYTRYELLAPGEQPASASTTR